MNREEKVAITAKRMAGHFSSEDSYPLSKYKPTEEDVKQSEHKFAQVLSSGPDWYLESAYDMYVNGSSQPQ